MKFSVCVEAVFKGRDFCDSVREIKALGYDAIEFWEWKNKDIDAVKKVCDELDMKIAGFCTKIWNLVDPGFREAYVEGLKESIEVAKKLGVSKLITQTGNNMEGVSREAQKQSMIDGLKACAPILESAGITLMVEPLNVLVDHKKHFLFSSEEGAEIVAAVGSPNVKMLFDIYHQQITEGNLIANIEKYIDSIAHFHAAGNPGRNEIHKGEINYKNIFEKLDGLGYDGYVGLEYFPNDDPAEGLKIINLPTARNGVL